MKHKQVINFLRQVSIIISRCFDIYVVFPILILIDYFVSLSSGVISPLWPILFFIILAVIPVTTSFYMLHSHVIKDWDISARKDRTPYMLRGVIVLFLLLVCTIVFKAPLLFTTTATLLCILECLYTLVTLYWKISMHAQLITLLCIYLTVFLGKTFAFSFLLIPIVFFARIDLKEHTLLQLIAGSLLTTIVSLLTFALFGQL